MDFGKLFGFSVFRFSVFGFSVFWIRTHILLSINEILVIFRFFVFKKEKNRKIEIIVYQWGFGQLFGISVFSVIFEKEKKIFFWIRKVP